MARTFISEAVGATRCVEMRAEITFVDANGGSQTISITPVTANVLLTALQDFSRSSSFEGPVATKMPRQVTVGCGRYEQVVLVRFEDEAPYGLDAAQAAELGWALVQQAAMTTGQSAPLRQ